jgi:hypothetical protein
VTFQNEVESLKKIKYFSTILEQKILKTQDYRKGNVSQCPRQDDILGEEWLDEGMTVQ